MTTNKPTVANPDPLLSVAEVAHYASVSAQFVYRVTSDGSLPCVRLGRAIRVRRSALDSYLRAAEGRN